MVNNILLCALCMFMLKFADYAHHDSSYHFCIIYYLYAYCIFQYDTYMRGIILLEVITGPSEHDMHLLLNPPANIHPDYIL